MRRLSLFCLLFIPAILQYNSANAQRDEWRVIKKTRTETNGQKFNTEYAYNNNGQIESVKYLTIGNAVNITISDFKFDRNKKPLSYIVTWNREGGKANVFLKYDNDGRVIELKKVNDNRETSLFTYRYSEKEIFIIEQKSNVSSGNIKDNKITFYTDQGDYNVTTSDAASQTITSVITLKQNNSVSKTYPESFMGGFEAPRFLGVTAFGSEPEITVTKNDIGLITSLTWVNRSGTRKNEYEYLNIKKGEPIVTSDEKNAATIINTNINCAAGKEIVERILKTQDGVQSVKIDIKTGKLSLAYSSDGTAYTEIIRLINDAGFDADRTKAISPEKNPCKKAEPAEKTSSITIQTNINCEIGKRKVESLIKELSGVTNATADIRSGKLVIEYSKRSVESSQIIRLINQAGFDAENAKSKNPENNPCKTAEPAEQTNSITTQTNINCAEGKQQVESFLKERKGVVSATADIRSGKLVLEYNKANINIEEINSIINSAGFDVNGKKSISPDKNPCIKKPEPVEEAITSTIRTNITCELGKEQIETRLKEQKGVLNADLDLNTARVKVEYRKNKISLEKIIQVINDAGFDADKNKAANPDANPCKNIDITTTSINVQTNINCEEGKQNVETLLREQRGILSVKINIKTGMLVIEYKREENTAAEITTLINRAGFDTEGKKTSNSENNPCIKKPEPINTSTINGRFFYRYKKENEEPKSGNFSFPGATKIKKLNNPPFNSVAVVPNDEPYPDYICNGLFDKKNEARVLKNANIRLVYTILTSTNEAPTEYQDLKALSDEEIYNYSHISALWGSEFAKADVKIKTGKTDENGNFSISFLNNLKIGPLGSDKIEGYKTEVTFDKYGNKTTKSIPDGTSKTVFKYGVVRLAIEEDYFSNSDVIMFPKPGKTMVLPDEVIFPQSHNLEITVKTDATIVDQALTAGIPVDGYPLRLSALASTYPLLTSSYPVESNIEEYKELNAEVSGEPVKVLDLGKTNAKGIFTFHNLASSKKIVQALEQKLEGNYVYDLQTKSEYDEIPAWRETGVHFDNSNFSISKLNSALWIATTKKEIIIKPKKPEIYLRAITVQGGHTKGIANVTVTITEYENLTFFSPFTVDYYKTDENGYLHLTDLKIKTEKQGDKTKVIGPYRTIKLSKTGFADLVITKKQNLQFGERFPASVDQLMKGAGSIVGQVVNEKGEPVVSNVRVGAGPFIKTASNGWYEIDNCQTGFTSIEIVPAVDNYFPETVYQVINDGYNLITNIKGNKESKVVVKEKLHRVRFKIVDENNKIITQSCSSVGINVSTCFASDASTGLTNEITIASPDLEFHVRTVASGYVTYDDYVEIPISKTPKVILIKLIKGQLITGIVKDAKTQQPIKGARVYAVSGTNEDGEIQNETFTDDDGKYTLSGVINQGTWMENIDAYLQLPVKVFAVKSGEPAYIRQVQSVQGLNGKGNADFNLNVLNAKAEIWGLQIEITDATSKGDKIKLTGSFVKLPANSTFKPAMFNTTLPFKDVEVVFEKSGALTENKIKPVKSSIELEATAFKVTAFDKYACEVIGTGEENKIKKLTVNNDKGCGTINGFITSQLSSFNFSYNYTGKFLLDYEIKTPVKSATSKPLPVFAVTECYVPINKFNVSALYGKSNFSIHNFNATLAAGSYFDKEAFFLNADVKLQIPLVGATTMPAGQIKIVQNNIIWNEYNGKINLPLEKWAVTGNGLRYDINQGGFRVIDGSLQTDLPQVPLKDLIINPTTIDLGTNTLTGNEVLTLAKVTPLYITPGARLTLDYDAAAPFDQKPHYRINLTSKNKTVAYVDNLPGMAKDDKVKIEILSAYSDGEHKTVLVNPEKHTYYNVVSQNVSGIQVLENSFTLIGNTDVGIPGANNNVTGRFQFYKDAADKDKDANGLVCKVQKMQTDIQMEGKVKFNGTTFLLSQNNLRVKGDVLMYKESISDAIKGIHGILTKTTSNTVINKKPPVIKMDINPNEKIVMGSGGGSRFMTIQNGGNYVDGNTWSLVKFTAKPEGFKTNGKEILTDKGNLIDFVVNGAIESDKKSKKVIAIDGVETPFGNLAISLDFEKKILVGSLTLDDANIPLGPVRIMDGTIDMQIDNNGFILVGAITEAQFTIPVPLISDFKSGIAIGFYEGPLPQYMTNNLLDVTLYKKLPGLEDGLKGFYVNVMKSLTKDDLKKSIPGPNLDDIPLVSSFIPSIEFFAGIDIRTSVNLVKGKFVTISGMAEANASISATVAKCTIGMSAGAGTNFNLTYANESFTGSIVFEIKGGIEYCVGKKDIKVSLILEKTPKDFNIDASFK